jgi:hypothetical protein
MARADVVSAKRATTSAWSPWTAIGQDALVVHHRAAHHDDVIICAVRGRIRVLVGHLRPPSLLPRADPPVRASFDRSGGAAHETQIERQQNRDCTE